MLPEAAIRYERQIADLHREVGQAQAKLTDAQHQLRVLTGERLPTVRNAVVRVSIVREGAPNVQGLLCCDEHAGTVSRAFADAMIPASVFTVGRDVPCDVCRLVRAEFDT